MTKLAPAPGATDRIPSSAATFDLNVALSPAEAGSQTRKFAGKANSGNVMPDHWYWGNLGIEMSGLTIGRQDLPVLFQHDPCEPVGYTTKITAGPDGIDVEGVLLGVTEKGAEIIALLEAKMPLQMSMYAPPAEVLLLQSGESGTVNGRPISGPGAIFTSSRLREVTITTLGVDEGTSAALLSAGCSFSTSLREQKTTMATNDPTAGGTPAPAPAPASAAQLAQAKQDAATAERARILSITKLGAGLPQDIVERAISDGLDEGRAALLFLDAERKGKENRLAEIRKTTPAALGVDDADPAGDAVTKFKEGGAPAAKKGAVSTEHLSVADKAKAEFASSKDLQDEFASEADYVALCVYEAKKASRKA